MPSKGAFTLLNLVTVIAVAVAAFYFGEQSALRKLGNKKDEDEEKKDKEETKIDVEIHNNETQSDTDNIVEESKNENVSIEENSEDNVELHSSSSSCSFEMVEKDGTKKIKQETKEDIIEMTDDSSYQIQPIGYIRSIYRLCVGTPRQGLLAPNSRGRIDFISKNVSPDSILELEHFSHLWILFQFHLNTKGKDSKGNNNNNNKSNQQFPSKIAPPALGGKKVGIFATRTPHRPNAIGFTLCKLESITLPQKQKKKSSDKNNSAFSINVSGIDLVDGTPVFDIKPFVPHYDSVGYEQSSSNAASLPTWVSSGLGKRREVIILPHARNQLEIIMKHESDNGMKFYGVKTGRDESEQDALQHIIDCIMEVLSVDVRSAWQTKKARKGKFQAERANRIKQVHTESQSSTVDKTSAATDGDINLCTQQIDNLLIKYSVKSATTDAPQCELPPVAASPINTDGSGADDQVIVQAIELITQGNNFIEITSIQNEKTIKKEEELESPEKNRMEEKLDDNENTAPTNEPKEVVLDELEEPAKIDIEKPNDNNNTASSESNEKSEQIIAKNGIKDLNENANNTVTEVYEEVKTSVPKTSDSPCVDDPNKANEDTTEIETETNANPCDQVDLQAHIHEICELNEKIRSSKESITSKTEQLGDNNNNNNANNTEEGTRSSTSSFSNGSFVVVDQFTMPVSEISIVDSSVQSSAEHNEKEEVGKDGNAVNDDKVKTSLKNQNQETLLESSHNIVEKIAQTDKNKPKVSISKVNPTVSSKKTATVDKLPADGHTSFGSLKSFWSQRGTNYTPNGLVPEKTASKQQTKFFVYSDKPIQVPSKKATKSSKTSSTGSVEQPILKEDDTSLNNNSEHQTEDDLTEPNKVENEPKSTSAKDNETDEVSPKIEE